jgi:hypothetical protein
MKTIIITAPKGKIIKQTQQYDSVVITFEDEIKKIIDRVKSFEDACAELGINPEDLFDPIDTSDEIAYKKIKIIARALNDGWIPNWNNTNQYKWFPWFNLSSGFGFSGSGYGYARTTTVVGSRLCFKSEELANYAGKQFTNIYKDFLTYEKEL